MKSYDGKNHSVSNITVKSTANAGLFGELQGVEADPPYTVSNLTLVNFNIEGTDNAGAIMNTTEPV